MIKDFEQISHTADLQIKVYGKTISQLFEHALLGMFTCMHPRTQECEYKNDRLLCKTLSVSRDIGINSPDQNALLVDFLSYALYLSDVHNEAYLKVHFTTFETKTIVGQLYGINVVGFEESEIKAVTYHSLDIIQENGLWQTNIVFDI